MIRVNLLSMAARAERRREWLRPDQRPAAWGLMLLSITAAALVGWWLVIGHQRAVLDRQIAAAEADLTRFKTAALLVDAAATRRADLADRLALIDRLRASERDPVELLAAVSRSLPDGLWLAELTQKGDAVQIDGHALTLTAVTDFVERLQTCGRFQHPVDIVSTSAAVLEDQQVVKFSVKAQALRSATMAPTSAPPATGKAGM